MHPEVRRLFVPGRRMMRNMAQILNFLLFTIIFLEDSVNCWSAPVKLQDEPTASYAVFDHLFADYNKHVRPVRNSTTVTHVFMDIGLRGILGTDAVQQVIVLKEWLRMFWKDEFLRWNPEDYGGIREIQVPRSMIWLPDVTLIDLVSKMQTLADDRSFVIVDHEGFVRHSVDQVVTVFCDYRITMFPFDQQNCSVHFEPWHSTVNEVLLQVGPLPDTTHYRPSNEWELVSYSARTGQIKYQSILPYETSRVFYDIVIRRRPHYYVASFMLPCFIIMELSLLGLFSPSNDSGEHSEKVTMGLTSLLSMTVLLLMISESLPKTNQGLPLLGLFVLVEIFIGALATATTVCVSHLQSGWRRSKRIPPFLKYLERWHPLRTRVHRKKSSEGDLFAATWKETHSVRDLAGIRENTRKTGIMAQIGNFEYNMRMISASLERKAAHSRLRLQWASACERLDHLLLVLFLSVNAVFFVSILIIGYST